MSLPGTPKPTVADRLRPDSRMEISAKLLPTVAACEAVDRQQPSFCPQCAILGQRVLLSGTHFKRTDGTVVSEFGCACGHTKLVEYQTHD
jgi:hypothetical protein